MTEVTLKIDMKAFSRIVRGRREEIESGIQEGDIETLAEVRAVYRKQLDAVWDLFRRTRRAINAPGVDRSYAGHLAALQMAARPLMQFGASDAQIRYLASFYAEAGEAVEPMTRLTKLEASALIDLAKRDAARRDA